MKRTILVLMILMAAASYKVSHVQPTFASYEDEDTTEDTLDPSDCSRGIDESNQENCSDF